MNATDWLVSDLESFHLNERRAPVERSVSIFLELDSYRWRDDFANTKRWCRFVPSVDAWVVSLLPKVLVIVEEGG